MTDKHLDDAIVRAVREMMNVDADSAFRARVFARLDRRPRRGLRWFRLAVAGAAAVALLLAVVMTRNPTTPRAGQPDIASTQRRPAAAPGAVPSPPAEEAEERVRPAQVAVRDELRASPRPRRRPVATPAPNVTQSLPPGALVATVADPQPDAAAIVPASHLDPIVVPRLESTPITPAPIVIAPLAPIKALEIAPLPPRLERD